MRNKHAARQAHPVRIWHFVRIRAAGLLVLTSIGCPLGVAVAGVPVERTVDAGWMFRLADPQGADAKQHPDSAHWRTASVPGSVQTDLLALGAIANPTVGNPEGGLQWIGLTDWEYATEFEADGALLAHRHVELVFEGLDTFADVTLNGKPLLSADNMHRTWRLDVEGVLAKGRNRLTVTLHSPIRRIQPWLLKQPYALPGAYDSPFGDEPKGIQSSPYVRKAAYGYGWDWGPRYVTQGIWRPVRLEAWDDVRVTDLAVLQQRVDATAAQLDVSLSVQADRTIPLEVRGHYTGPDGHTVDLAAVSVTVDAGQNTVSLPIRIASPARWWPVGYGAQNLYRFEVDVLSQGQPVAHLSRRTGLRSIELRRPHDQWGTGFEFVVNGVPVYAKGANVIPFDSFPSRVGVEQLRQVLTSARDANMNMVRNWGGGYYEQDAYFDIADELGLMVWQEFMFGGALMPADAGFRANVRAEAEDQVRRLRNHPSIVLWCGNNEVEDSWQNWGDRQEFRLTVGQKTAQKIWTDNVVLFDRVLREVLGRLDPAVPYWPTSPGSDFEAGAGNMSNGDVHYWKVWSGSAPIENYLDVVPRFMSEFGLQAFPDLRTVHAFAPNPADWNPESTVLRAHQKFANGDGNDRLLFYIRKYYGEPRDFDSFVYLSQLMQAEGIELAVEHLRSHRPQNMGVMYWQLNDVWPGASWASIDWYGRWKALQFHARRFYNDVIVAPIHRDGKVLVTAISDRTAATPAEVRTRVMDVSGKVLSDTKSSINLQALAATSVGVLNDADLLHGADPHRTVAVFDLTIDGQVTSRQVVYFERATGLTLPSPGLETTLTQKTTGVFDLTLSTTALARGVWVDFGDLDARVSDNSLTLLPGESVTLTVTSSSDLPTLREHLRAKSLVDALSPVAH